MCKTSGMHRRSLLRSLWLPLLTLALASGCDSTTSGDDGDAAADAGDDEPPYTGPAYERAEGWYPADGLHDHPAACGAADYRWWGTSDLGKVLERQLKHNFTAQVLGGFKSAFAQTAALSRDPEFTSALYRIRYQTQDRGSLIDATAMVAYPLAPASGPMPVLVYLHGTAGFTDACSPSYGIEGAFSSNYVNAAIVGMFASWGYVVVAPDYIGMKSVGEPSSEYHPYLVGEPTAIASLDAVRAARNLLADVGASVEAGDDVVLYGISQGGHAAAFTARYAPHYAPDISVKAAVYAVPPLDLVAESAAALSVPTPVSLGNAAAFLVGAEDWYEVAGNDFSAAFIPPSDVTVTDALDSTCGAPSLPGLTVDSLFTDAVRQGEAPFGCYIKENSLLHTSVPRLDDTPGLVIVADSDELVNTPVERTAFDTLCDVGHELQYLECQNASHIGGAFFSLDDAFDFMEARLAGEPMTRTCQRAEPSRCSSDPR